MACCVVVELSFPVSQLWHGDAAATYAAYKLMTQYILETYSPETTFFLVLPKGLPILPTAVPLTSSSSQQLSAVSSLKQTDQ